MDQQMPIEMCKQNSFLINKFNRFKMKNLIALFFFIIPLLGHTQAHLGETFDEIKARYPDLSFKIEYMDSGTKYTTAEHKFGTFVYYFDSYSGITDFCIQIPKSPQALSAQIEIYNRKYVIISDKKWKAYLPGGAVMDINLIYDDENEKFVFVYQAS